MRRILVVLVPLILACSIIPTPIPSPTVPSGPSPIVESPLYTGLNLQSLGAYQATFEMQFKGTYDWSYDLETRTDGRAVEYHLHLEGVSSSRNPGDVRVVMEGDTIRMRGPGTDDECLLFPSDLELGVAFLTPDDLINPQALREPLTWLDNETIADTDAAHYTVQLANLDDWHDLEIDLWLDDRTGAVLRYELDVTGPDPLFDAGEGTLTGQFLVNDVGPQAIEAITGCEIDLPLPPDATRLTRLPGLITFESATTPDELAIFYQTALTDTGWESLDEPQIGDDAILLSFHRGEQTLEVNIETNEEGAHVELLLGKD